MRAIHTLPLLGAMLLAACGGSDDQAGDGLSPDDIAARSAGMIQPRPGQYNTRLELLEFDAPGVPAAARQQLEQVFASGLAQGNTFCLTEEEAARGGAEEMVKNFAESDCTMNAFNVTGNQVTADMTCAGEGMGSSRIRMDGRMDAESSTMTMAMEQSVPGAGETRMRMRVDSERVGDCPA